MKEQVDLPGEIEGDRDNFSLSFTDEYDPNRQEHRRMLGDELVRTLTKAGFSPYPDARGEITYQREIDTLPLTFVRIYTTIPLGRRSVRNVGKDAIRVCSVFDNGETNRGLVKERRVYRTGTIHSIVERTLERARDAWSTAKKRTRCGYCQAPTFTSRNGNEVCAAVCWSKNKE